MRGQPYKQLLALPVYVQHMQWHSFMKVACLLSVGLLVPSEA